MRLEVSPYPELFWTSGSRVVPIQVVAGIVEPFTSIPDSDVNIKLESTAEVPTELDRSKVRTLVENVITPGFIDKEVK